MHFLLFGGAPNPQPDSESPDINNLQEYPAYLEVFEQVTIGERRDLLKAISSQMNAILNNDVPESLKNKVIYSLDLGLLIAGTKYQGEFEDRIKNVLKAIKELKDVLKYAVEEAKNQLDVRFNFFVTPEILSYLDWITQRRRIPRAVYLRKMIEDDMKKNRDYEKE